jgi:hypothetical protein
MKTKISSARLAIALMAVLIFSLTTTRVNAQCITTSQCVIFVVKNLTNCDIVVNVETVDNIGMQNNCPIICGWSSITILAGNSWSIPTGSSGCCAASSLDIYVTLTSVGGAAISPVQMVHGCATCSSPQSQISNTSSCTGIYQMLWSTTGVTIN